MSETKFKIALISDIHGNTWALETVLEDIERRGINTVLNLGDSVYGPLDPAGTARLLMSRDFITVAGNQDRNIVESRNQDPKIPTMRFVLNELDESILDWLESLPMTRVAEPDIFLCHGNPVQDDRYLVEQVGREGVKLKNPAALDAMLTTIEQSIVACGHSHVFSAVTTPSGKLILNAGSVGLPAYQDEEPFVHTMENGTPHARYLIITVIRTRTVIEQIALPYDWRAAARRASENNRPDWEKWLTTGRA